MLKTFSSDVALFTETSKNYQDILSTYLGEYKNIKKFYNPWTYTCLFDILNTFSPQYQMFECIKNNIDSINDNGDTLASISISDINREDGTTPHKDNHPIDGRFKRFHLALQLTPTSKIHVTDDNGNSDVYEWELGKWMEFDGVKYLHYPENLHDEPRVLLIIDVFSGQVSDEDLYDYYIERQRLLKVDDFMPAYEVFVASR